MINNPVNCLIVQSIDERCGMIKDGVFSYTGDQSRIVEANCLLDEISKWLSFVNDRLYDGLIVTVPEHFFSLNRPLSLQEYEKLMLNLDALFSEVDPSVCFVLSSFPVYHEDLIHWFSSVFFSNSSRHYLSLLKKTCAIQDPSFNGPCGELEAFDCSFYRLPALPSIHLCPYNRFKWRDKTIRVIICKDVALEHQYRRSHVDILLFVADTCGLYRFEFNANQVFVADPFYICGRLTKIQRECQWAAFLKDSKFTIENSDISYEWFLSIIKKNPGIVLTSLFPLLGFMKNQIDELSLEPYFDKNLQLLSDTQKVCAALCHFQLSNINDLFMLIKIIGMLDRRNLVPFKHRINRFFHDRYDVLLATTIALSVVLIIAGCSRLSESISCRSDDMPMTPVNAIGPLGSAA